MEPTFFIKKIVLMKDDKILILKRTNYKKDGDVWDLPGGKVEFAEDCKVALKRECVEEVGVVLNSFKVLDVVSGKGYTTGQFIFVLCASSDFDGEIKLSHEHDDLKWINPKEIFDYKLLGSVDLVKEVISKL